MVDLGAVILGALVGGRVGSVLQSGVSPLATRRVLAVVLVVVAVLVLVR